MENEDNLLTSRMRECKRWIEIKKKKGRQWTYEMGLRFLILSYIGNMGKRKQYRETGRLFLELSAGYAKSDAVLATFCGGFPPYEIRKSAVEEIRKYIESVDNVFIKDRRKYKKHIS